MKISNDPTATDETADSDLDSMSDYSSSSLDEVATDSDALRKPEISDQLSSIFLSNPTELLSRVGDFLAEGDLSRLCWTCHKSNSTFRHQLVSYAGYIDSANRVSVKEPMTKKGWTWDEQENHEKIRDGVTAMTFRIRDDVIGHTLPDESCLIPLKGTLKNWDFRNLPTGVASCHFLVDLPLDPEAERWDDGYDNTGIMRELRSSINGRGVEYMSLSTRHDAFDGWRWLYDTFGSIATCKTLVFEQPLGSLLTPVRAPNSSSRYGAKDPERVVIITGREVGKDAAETTSSYFQYSSPVKTEHDTNAGEEELTQLEVLCRNLAYITPRISRATRFSLVGSERWNLRGLGYDEVDTSTEAIQAYIQRRIDAYAATCHWRAESPQYEFLTFKQAKKDGLLPSQRGRHWKAEAEVASRAADHQTASRASDGEQMSGGEGNA